MSREHATPERLSAFSDAVFAVLITVLVLELRPPESPTFAALFSLWERWLSYAVSYLFIAIVWVNHHHLMRYASAATPGLIWFNFGHLLSVSLLPLATAWMAVSELSPQPVAFWELIGRRPAHEVAPPVRRLMLIRAAATLCLFGSAAFVALRYPIPGLAICCGCLILYLKPGALSLRG
jgi:uncharacterized membrane protein